MELSKQINHLQPKGGCPMFKSIHHYETIYNLFRQLNLGSFLSDVYLEHIASIITSVFKSGYSGKTVDFGACSDKHRTSVSHFLCDGKWNDSELKQVLKDTIVSIIYDEARKTGKPVFCIADDTISSVTIPSSLAKNPIQAAYFHWSHLKKCHDYGHQAVTVLLSCNGITLCYAVEMYDKTQSKIELVRKIAEELPVPPTKSYFLCDSWYSSEILCNEFSKKGFYTIGAAKTNRVIFPCGIHQQVKEFAKYIEKNDTHLVTVGKCKFYVYRYEGNLQNIENAVVLITYPKNAFGDEKSMRAFLCTNTDLSDEDILNIYAVRWNIEVFFRESKRRLAFDKYQIRSSKGISRYWLIMSLVHFLCCITAENHTFTAGFTTLKHKMYIEFVCYLYNCGKNSIPIEELLNNIG